MAGDDFDRLTKGFLSWFTSVDRQTAGTYLGPHGSSETPILATTDDDVVGAAAAGPLIDIVDKRPEGRGRAVVALRDIEPETNLFTVSHSDILSLATSNAHQILTSSQRSLLPPWIACVFALIYEHGQGPEGKWWPYLCILPESLDTLIHWSDTELSELQGSHAVQKIGRTDAEVTIKEQLWPIIRANVDRFGTHARALSNPIEADALKYLYGLAHRFATLILAYAFDLDQDDEDQDPEKSLDEDGFVEDTAPPKGMVPFADMLNAEGEELNNARLFHGESSVSMVSIKPIKAGTEILNDYGALPNAELLRCYGYVAPAYDQYDVAELDTEKLEEIAKRDFGMSDRQIEKRLDLAERWDVIDSSFDLMRNPGQENPLDRNLLLTAMLLTATDGEYREYKQLKKTPQARVNSKTAQLLGAAIEQRQHEYTTSIAEDKLALDHANTQPGKASRVQMALKVRLGEKEILAQTLQYVRELINMSEGDISPANDEPEPKRLKV